MFLPFIVGERAESERTGIFLSGLLRKGVGGYCSNPVICIFIYLFIYSIWRMFIWFDFGRYCGIILFPSFEDVIPAQSVTAGQAELEIGMSF